MGRRGYGQLIETWEHHRYKEKANIHLSKEDGEFRAVYGENILKSKTLEDLRSQLTKLVEELVKLDWIPVLQISVSGSSKSLVDRKTGFGSTSEEEEDDVQRIEKSNATMRVDFERYWIAKKPDGKWLSCHIWHSEDVDGKSDRYTESRSFRTAMPRRLNAREFYLADNIKDFSLPCKHEETRGFRDDGPTYYVHYTPQLWAGLNEIAWKLDELREKLTELVTSDRGLLLVEGLIQKLLPAPQETKSKKRKI